MKKRADSLLPSIGKILRLLLQTKPDFLILLTALNMIQGVFPAVFLWLSKGIIDRTIRGIGGGHVALAGIMSLLFLLFLVNVLSSLILNAGGYITTNLQDMVANKINMEVMEKSASLDLYHYESPVFYDMLSRAQREASFKPVAIISNLLEFGKSLITISSLIVVLCSFHWLAVAALVILGVPHSYIQHKFARRGYNLVYSQTQESRRAFYCNFLLTSIGFFKEIKIFRLKDHLIEQYRKSFLALFRQNKKLLLKKHLALVLISVVSNANYAIVYALIIKKAVDGMLSIGEMTLYAGAFLQCQTQMSGMISNFVTLFENNLFIQNLFKFLDLQPTIKKMDVPLVNKECHVFPMGIIFNRVTFHYPESGKCILKDFNLFLKPNESVAIIGENGSGKTTIVKLLCRLYDPDNGEILLDGVDIRSIEPDRYRSIISVIFQDYAKYFLTVRENVGFGEVNDLENISRIRRAAMNSGADRVVARMPKEYDSILGRYFDDGTQLSSGEWQKIALARALMRDGRIIIWDEPTSAVDAQAEYELFKRFKDIAKDRISLLISHKYSLVRNADRIVVLGDGRIVEEGCPWELLRKNGKYASFYKMQVEEK